MKDYRIKNSKGFTLIEVIGAVIILGILAIIAVPVFTKNLEEFRDDFYVNIVNTLEASGEEFFTDNRNYRPNGYLETSKVSLNTLLGQNYLDDIVDYNGDSCNKDSYVIVIRKGKNDYDYHVCLRCDEDDYDNTKDNIYCDSSWLDSTKIDYDLGDIKTIYVYKGTDRDTLKEKTTIPLWVVKYDDKGNEIDRVEGTGEEGVPEVYPIDLDRVNTDVVGSYEVNYQYIKEGDNNTEEETVVTGTVVVYENGIPEISINKENVVKTGGANDTNSKTETTGYTGIENAGEENWAQKLIISFKRGAGEFGATKTGVSKYQWKRGDKWIDICVPTSGNECVVTVTEEMNEVVYFRTVDSEGNIGQVSRGYRIRIDNTKPVCKVIDSGTKGLNDWYRSDVKITFVEANTYDNVADTPVAVSGIRKRVITTSSIGTSSVTSGTQTNDTKSITWYGYVEDKAQNYKVCDVTFKRDVTKPTATWKTDVAISGDGTYHSNSGINVTATCVDPTSGVNNETAPTTTIHISSPSNPGKATKVCTDNAGNTATISTNYYVAKKCQSTACGWNSCLTGENTCSYGCDRCTRQSCSGKTWQSTCDGYKVGGDCYDTCSTVSYSCNCSSCKYGHNTCKGGYNTCWATYCDV